MIPDLRRDFNARFTPEKYQQFLRALDEGCGTHVKFRNSETPLFLPRELFDRMASAGVELIAQLMTLLEYLAMRSSATIPAEFNVPNETGRPVVRSSRFSD